jgi:putative hydrolase of the HAD superfamily
MTVRPEMLDLTRQLRSRVSLAILTNNGALLEESLPALVPELCEIFGAACHATARFKARKPDPVVYQRLVACHAVAPAAAIFIDDDRRNVEGAVAAGLAGVHFEGMASLRTELASLL